MGWGLGPPLEDGILDHEAGRQKQSHFLSISFRARPPCIPINLLLPSWTHAKKNDSYFKGASEVWPLYPRDQIRVSGLQKAV